MRIYPKRELLSALRRHPALFEAFAARLARQLQGLRARMELRNIRSARERLLQYLWLSAEGRARAVAIDGHLQDVAADFGREAFYRTLAALEADGVVERSARGLLLKKAPDT